MQNTRTRAELLPSHENNTALEIYAIAYAGGVAEALIRLKILS